MNLFQLYLPLTLYPLQARLCQLSLKLISLGTRHYYASLHSKYDTIFLFELKQLHLSDQDTTRIS